MIYQTSPLAIAVFSLIVAVTLLISFYFGAKARSARGYFAAGGGTHWFVNGVAFAGGTTAGNHRKLFSHLCLLLTGSRLTPYLSRLNRRLFITTDTDETAIAPAAIVGVNSRPKAGNSTPAATGIPIVL